MNTQIISKEELLVHWQGHRNLTRRTIEKFPEEALFTYHVEGMRTFADLIKELLGIAVPALEDINSRQFNPYNHDFPYNLNSINILG